MFVIYTSPSKLRLAAIALLTASCALASASSTAAAQEPDKLNVLMIIVDDLRPELGAYGAKHAKTPSMDKLAASSMLFERAYCNIPVCGASRASVLTGIRPGKHRFIDFTSRADQDAPNATPLPQMFKDAGYTTVSNGKVFHSLNDSQEAWDDLYRPKPKLGGWRDYVLEESLAPEGFEGGQAFEKADVPDEAYRDGEVAIRSMENLRRFKESGEPFFLAVGFHKPHLPFNAPSKYWELYDREQFELPETYERHKSIPGSAFHNSGELRSAYYGVPNQEILPRNYALELIHGYHAATSYVDAQIGKVLDELDKLGLRENTVVVLWGDHGYNLGEHTLWCKHCNFNTSLQVPLMIDVPGMEDGRNQSLVEYVDLYPTLVELLGLKEPEDQLQGDSLTPILRDPNAKIKDFVISKWLDGISLRTDRYLYTMWLDKEEKVETHMLFDHQTDPKETVNIANEPENAELVQQFEATLRDNWGENFYEKPPQKK